MVAKLSEGLPPADDRAEVTRVEREMAEIEATMTAEQAVATELWARLERHDTSTWTTMSGPRWRDRSYRRWKRQLNCFRAKADWHPPRRRAMVGVPRLSA